MWILLNDQNLYQLAFAGLVYFGQALVWKNAEKKIAGLGLGWSHVVVWTFALAGNYI